MSMKPGCKEGSLVLGSGSQSAFTFHIVLPLKLHLTGPEQMALRTAAVAVQGMRDTRG